MKNINNDWKRNIALFMAGQALSFFGSMLAGYAVLWHITLKTQSGSMMTLFAVAGILPMFFMSPFGGVWSDRLNRKNLINIADGATALVSLFVGTLVSLGFDNTGVLLACTAVRSLGQGVQTPAVGSLIPQLVPREHLTRINGIQSSVHSFVMIASPMLSGAIMSFAPLNVLFFIDVATAIIGISILLFLVRTPPPDTRHDEKPDYFRDLKEGMMYVSRNGFIIRLIAFCGIYMIFATPAMFLTPLQVTRKFGDDVWRLTAIELIYSVGMMLGGLAVGLWGGFKNRVYTIAMAITLFGVEAAALGLLPNFWVYLLFVMLTGMTVPYYTTPVTVLLQTKVEKPYLGRVLSIFSMTNSIAMPVGMVVFGFAADMVDIDYILLLSGAVMFFWSLPFAANKTLRSDGVIGHAETGGQSGTA